MDDLTALRRDVLFIVASEGRPSGATIVTRMREYREDGPPQNSVYNALNDLVDLGLLEKGAADGRTNWYTLTKTAEEEMRDRIQWTLRKVSGNPRARPPWLARYVKEERGVE